MNQLLILQKKSIDLVKKGDWESALETNLEILKDNPDHVSTLNRVGFCYLQLNKKNKAKEVYERVLEKERLNPIAKKYLILIKQKGEIKQKQVDAFEDFVEEPGKTKIVSLGRLAGASVLSELSVASSCVLKPKGRYVTVLTQGHEYIGSLPEDISVHLSQLIKTGNEYACVIRSVSKQECTVFIKEKSQSPENKHVPSFPMYNRSAQADADEDILVSDMIDTDDVLTIVEKDIEIEDDDDLAEALPPDVLVKVVEE